MGPSELFAWAYINVKLVEQAQYGKDDTPEPTTARLKLNLKKALASMFYALAAGLEPWRYPVESRRHRA